MARGVTKVNELFRQVQMRPEQQTTIPEIPHVHKMNLVLFCPKHNFNVVKQQHKVRHVNLGIFSTPNTYKEHLKRSNGYLVMK